jgi:Protein of unknown function (DUF4232)
LIVRRNGTAVVAAIGVTAVLAACGTGSRDVVAPAASPAAVEPVAALQTPSAAPETDGSGSACTSRDVELDLGDDPSGGATGERSVALRLTNNGSRTCVLEGRPSVEFLDSDDRNVGLREGKRPGGPYIHSGTAATFRLRPGSSADVVIAKYRCDLGDKTVATKARIGLPGAADSTTFILDRENMNGIASCRGGADDPGQIFAISGYTAFTCHLVGNATGGGWCDGDPGRYWAQTQDEAARAEEKEALARRHSSTTAG